MTDAGATPHEINTALSHLAKGDMPDSTNITKVIVDGYKDGVLIAGAAYLGPAASVDKVAAGGIIGAIANGSYQWFDMSQPGNENKSYDYMGTGVATITGGLAPERGIWQNVGIAAGGTMFTDGPDEWAVGISAAGAGLGGVFGKYAPVGVEMIFNNNDIPGVIYDLVGGLGTEYLGGYTKKLLNDSSEVNTHKDNEESGK
ncbi:hypothetical protein EDC52_1275 [Biostraticola tofi]|uniref:Adhesin n=1 Tax=Biostraticola tofi TaxID=466109 RepID=A0A4R3YEK6_9GAMM|nr:hypothetical protein EDC52_1275 [Biostraticola tofi]